MPEWLSGAIHNSEPIPPAGMLAVRLVLAILLGFAVAGVYHLSLGRRLEVRTLPTTLVLLSVLIALVTMVIGNSVARAFGLVGALSIVRFRTVVEDTRDTAFVIFAVVVGMAVGAGYLLLAVLGIPTVAVAALIMCRLDQHRATTWEPMRTLTVRLALGQDPVILGPVLERHVESCTFVSVGTARQGAVLEVVYSVRLRDSRGAVTLITELSRVEGVQGVELREASR